MKSGGAVQMHGHEVTWTVDGILGDPVHRLLAGFPRACAEQRAHDTTALITIRVTGSSARVHERDAHDHGDGAPFVQSFFHGKVRGLHRDGAFVLRAPSAEVSISADGRHIDAVVEREGYDERSFANTTLFVAFAVALRHRHLFHLHAGALVRGDGRRVLIMGESGAGKSTVTLALLDAGSQHVGDDSLFLAEREGQVQLLGFPRPFHLGPATLGAFPGLTAGPADAGGKRDVATCLLPGIAVDSMGPPDVVLFPRVTREPKTRAIEMGLGDAFGASLASAALVVVDGMPHKSLQLGMLRALLGKARAYDLALGADFLVDVQRAAELVPL